MSDSDDEDEIQDPSPAPIVRRRDKTGPKPRISESDAIALVRPMQAAITRAQESERRARREARVTELIGHDGEGGAFCELEKRMKALENKVEELNTFKTKALMLGSIGATVGSALAALVMKLLDKL